MDFWADFLTGLLHTWWFWPILVLYLLLGVRVGSFCHNVYENQENYPYVVRFIVSPLSTALREGWAGVVSKSGFSFNDYVVLVTVFGYIFRDTVLGEYPKASYIVTLSIGWGVKAAFNVVLILAIFCVSLLPTVLLIVLLIIGTIVGMLTFFVSLLIDQSKKLV